LHSEHPGYSVNKTQFFKLNKSLPETKEIRPCAAWHEDGSRCLPAQLFADFKGRGLVAFALVGLHIMHERPAQLTLKTISQGIELPQITDRSEHLSSISTDLHVLFHIHGSSLTRQASR